MMEQELISKKDLLRATGISYGQLYRWKRKQLIPEDWFIRKSTFTGQETFFPKDRVFERIEKIQALKDDLSLDDLAEMFSPGLSDVVDVSLPDGFTADKLIDNGVVTRAALAFFSTEKETYAFTDVLQIYIIDQLLTSSEINQEEARMMVTLLCDKGAILRKKACQLIFIRKFGASSCLLVTESGEIHFEAGTKVVKKITFHEVAEQLKSKLVKGGE